MMTCRLLCALLVLALCCCPSVCGADTDTESADVTEDVDEAGGGGAEQLATAVELPNEETVPSGLPVTVPGADQGTNTREGQRSTDKLPESDEAADTVQQKSKNGTTGRETDENASTRNTDKKHEDPFTMTSTTTTQAPTITTTTTTTTAPETSSTTTTEAPAVSTTRAPSRLREIDGSLSSSAWVCAPLVLAASALAYTAVG
ncbi:putative mucin TcMUCII [Trypanosoma cruzi]|uniref:Mucin TcMUCII, putative n=2 Tax=Trypanosoma cruzi TaxID=5693 RepID=Q4DR59_TRYCC|nr:mucin TcMUCII, putative [Trypanosoma cruzi]EAN95006.1 mucin TcMUCII, putative [Trypanosoma cruzi]PWV20995.1 putative mucin TcMUCII [Trypanosoma cruzi]|eukprot:XP_816857.1 mucin TcMUCII [Trypanosoma cruzi strain CL Brener]